MQIRFQGMTVVRGRSQASVNRKVDELGTAGGINSIENTSSLEPTPDGWYTGRVLDGADAQRVFTFLGVELKSDEDTLQQLADRFGSLEQGMKALSAATYVYWRWAPSSEVKTIEVE